MYLDKIVTISMENNSRIHPGSFPANPNRTPDTAAPTQRRTKTHKLVKKNYEKPKGYNKFVSMKKERGRGEIT